MTELDIQKLLCDVVNASGGQAFKLSNRFLVGVSDVIVKLPPQTKLRDLGAEAGMPRIHQPDKYPAGFIEVKQRTYTDGVFALDVTVQQQRFLEGFAAAGMPCGVASFMQKGTGSGLKLWLWLGTLDAFKRLDGRVDSAAHLELGRKGERENHMLSALYNWQKEWREGE